MEIYYKYLTFDEYRANYFSNELLRFTQPKDLNDPFECLPQKPSFEELTNLINILIPHNANNEVKLEVRKRYNSIYLDDLYSKQCNEVNNDIGIFSLSKNWNNILMWSHYTDSHKGFCIGFDSKHNYFKSFIDVKNNKSRAVYDVIYSSERYKIPMIPEKNEISIKPYITKSIDWKYEQEIRVISSLNLSDKVCDKQPYKIHLFKVPHSAICEIILGENIRLENEKFIRLFCKNKNIKIYKTYKSEIEFKMNRK
jgi:hypothetical protein